MPIRARSFDRPDEVRQFPHGTIEVLTLETLHGRVGAAHAIYEPGFKWSDTIGPMVKDRLCRVRHVGIVEAGQLRVVHPSGGEQRDLRPGDIYVIEPDHDKWVLGDEPFIAYEFNIGAVRKTLGRRR